MGSQALGSPAEAESPIGSSAPPDPRPGPVRPRPWVIAALFAGAWIVPILTQLTRTDPLLVLLIVFGTGGLLRVGASIVDRLFITLALLLGLAIVGGLLFSVWPWGLQPVAVGGLGLTLLVAGYVWYGAPPPWRGWPRKLLGSDAVLLIGLAGGFVVAYWQSFSTAAGNRLGEAGRTGDRLRQFSLFDSIHRYGGYTFLMQGKAKAATDPGVLAVYPPGQHYIYALGDVFLRSSQNPGNAVSEMIRYNIWVSLGYGFMVAAVAWAARWAAGPALKGWRRVFLVTAIAAFLTVGAFTSAIWCTWDSQVLGMAELALLAAVCFRPPTGWRAHAALLAGMFIAICMTYELFAPFAVILIAVSLFVYRKRLLPHWKPLLAVAIISAPMALSEYAAAHQAGLNGSAAASQSTGFTIPLSWAVLTVLGCFSVLGFAARPTRRLPSARAGLIAVLLSALAVLALIVYVQPAALVNIYYFQKVVQAWAVIMMVGAGFFGHLLRRPRLAVSGWKGLGIGVCALLLGIGATRSFWWSGILNQPTVYPAGALNQGAYWSPSASSTWASVWMVNGFKPDNIGPLATLEHEHQLLTKIPTITVVFNDGASNVNLSLQLSVLNQNAGLMSAVNYGTTADQYRGLNSAAGLVCSGSNIATEADWSPQVRQNLAQLEAGIKAVGVPIRVIVSTPALQSTLEQWGAQNPGSIRDVVYYSALTPTCP
jgi:hypothetical protein